MECNALQRYGEVENSVRRQRRLTNRTSTLWAIRRYVLREGRRRNRRLRAQRAGVSPPPTFTTAWDEANHEGGRKAKGNPELIEKSLNLNPRTGTRRKSWRNCKPKSESSGGVEWRSSCARLAPPASGLRHAGIVRYFATCWAAALSPLLQSWVRIVFTGRCFRLGNATDVEHGLRIR